MQIIDLFSGIGGFSLAGRWMDWRTIAFCEIDKFCQQVLKYHFPNVPIYEDIKNLDYEAIRRSINPDDNTILVGGFPCQPYSNAGKQLGTEDDRHLWPYMLTAIREIRPTWVVGENVRGLVSWNGGLVFDQMQLDLENEGYEVIPFLLPACGVNAPHKRERVWFVAKNTNKDGRGSNKRKEESGTGQFRNIGSGDNEWLQADNGKIRVTSNSQCKRLQISEQSKQQQSVLNAERNNPQTCKYGADSCAFIGIKEMCDLCTDRDNYEPNEEWLYSDTSSAGCEECDITKIANNKRHSAGLSIENWANFPTKSPLCRGNDGLSAPLDGITFPKWRNNSIKGFGNAIVPQVAYQIFKTIDLYEMLY